MYAIAQRGKPALHDGGFGKRVTEDHDGGHLTGECQQIPYAVAPGHQGASHAGVGKDKAQDEGNGGQHDGKQVCVGQKPFHHFCASFCKPLHEDALFVYRVFIKQFFLSIFD
jgi:hypothetical protein